MKTLFFAKSTNGFYDAAFPGVIPDDAVEISHIDYKSLLQEQSLGRRIVADEQGKPTITDYPQPSAPTYQELRAAEYPPMADYLDAVVKGDVAQQQAYIDACLAIKAKYPKP